MKLWDPGFEIFGCQILTDLPTEQMRSIDDVSDKHREAIVMGQHALMRRRHVSKFVIITKLQVVVLPSLEYDLFDTIEVADVRGATFMGRDNHTGMGNL
jgi:hypothetical protein